MKVKFMHVFPKGEHKIRIMGFKVMYKDMLPEEYVDTVLASICYTTIIYKRPCLFVQAVDESKRIKFNNFTAGTIISLADKEWIEATMATAGNRLCRINRRNEEKEEKASRRERAIWEGKVEIIKF